jgi:hypothetical protein
MWLCSSCYCVTGFVPYIRALLPLNIQDNLEAAKLDFSPRICSTLLAQALTSYELRMLEIFVCM